MESSAGREGVGGSPAAERGGWGRLWGLRSCWSPAQAQAFRERIRCLTSPSESVFISFFRLEALRWNGKKVLAKCAAKPSDYFFFLFFLIKHSKTNKTPVSSIWLTLSETINIYSSITCSFSVGAFQAPGCISALQECWALHQPNGGLQTCFVLEGCFFSPPSCCSHLDWGLYGWIYLKITEETNIYFFFPLLLVLVHLLSVLIYAKCVEIFNWIFLVLYTDIARKIIAVQIGVFLEPLCSLLMLFPNACVGK